MVVHSGQIIGDSLILNLMFPINKYLELFVICKRIGTSCFILYLGIDSYSEIVHKLIFSLKEHVFNSSNSIVTAIADNIF